MHSGCQKVFYSASLGFVDIYGIFSFSALKKVTLFLKFSVGLKCKDDTPSSSWVLCKDDEMMMMLVQICRELLGARYVSKHFTLVNTFLLHNNPRS